MGSLTVMNNITVWFWMITRRLHSQALGKITLVYLVSEISEFISVLESDDKTTGHEKNLIQVFHEYTHGNTAVTHFATYQEVPLLTPVCVLHEEPVLLSDYTWTHYNTWDCPYYMRCRSAEPERLFASRDELEEDWIKFCTQPNPDFSEFCNDIFGDG